MSLNDHVRRRIVAKRKELKITQRDMAATLGYNRCAYQRMETGDIKLTLYHIEKMSAALGCHYLTLLEGYTPERLINENAPRLDITDPKTMSQVAY